MRYAAITGWGEGLPPAVLTNADLATFLDTTDEWITTRTGMKERRVSHVSAIEMATLAASRALACAGLDASEVDLIVYGSCSNDEVVPNCASGVQVALGATHAGAMDVNTACTSFLYGLSTATALIQNGTIRNAIVIGVELITHYIDWSNRTSLCSSATAPRPSSCRRQRAEGVWAPCSAAMQKRVMCRCAALAVGMRGSGSRSATRCGILTARRSSSAPSTA
jgi:3-oxoacyl-[acyl-carrier-protein] synthase III